MPLVEKRYAEALVEMNIEKGEFYEMIEDFHLITLTYNENEDFRNFLLNPRISAAEKQKLIDDLFKERVKKEMLNYVKLLIEKGRIKFLPGIYSEYVKYADKFMNTLNITIISASPLDDEHVEAIKEKYKKQYKSAHVKANIEIDKNILGGLKIRIGDKLTDYSVKGRLDSLRKELVSD